MSLNRLSKKLWIATSSSCYVCASSIYQVLRGLTQATGNNRSMYIPAQEVHRSIDEAFGQVSMLIRSTLVVED
jgi:hypothetical protein